MSRLSEFLKNQKFNININLPFGGRKREEPPIKRPPKETKTMDKAWYKSKGKLGAIMFGLVYIAEHTLPALGVDIKIPSVVYTVLEGLFGSMSLYGIRAAIK